MINILLVGSGAREHAIAKAIVSSKLEHQLFCYGSNINPGIKALSHAYLVGSMHDLACIAAQAKDWQINLAIIGPEGPLEHGLVDILNKHHILTVGPNKALAKLETSKKFTRHLLVQHYIDASPKFQWFDSLDGVEAFFEALGEGRYVVKADGLMGGKGVKVAGEHLHSFAEAIAFCDSLIQEKSSFVIEEKLIGQEFSLMSFTDGKTIIPMPLVQDHKRAFNGDTGPNTGGMGSYSDANHSLPFLTESEVNEALSINRAVLDALQETVDATYKGILYGSFMATEKGVYLIEYNARFGDPEAMNVLSVFDGDFIEVCHAIATERLAEVSVSFKPKATVCKYAVPKGYPENPCKNFPIDVSAVQNKDQLFYASVNEIDGQLLGAGSRSIAVIGVGDTLAEAERQAEVEINRIQGDVYHRSDIGTQALVNQRIEMMKTFRNEACEA